MAVKKVEEEEEKAPRREAPFSIIDIRQRHLEAFEEIMLEEDEEVKPNRRRGQLVRWAIQSGWFDKSITDDFVGGMLPRDLDLVAEDVILKYNELTAFDPN